MGSGINSVCFIYAAIFIFNEEEKLSTVNEKITIY